MTDGSIFLEALAAVTVLAASLSPTNRLGLAKMGIDICDWLKLRRML
jgi:hypothetical protein